MIARRSTYSGDWMPLFSLKSPNLTACKFTTSRFVTFTLGLGHDQDIHQQLSTWISCRSRHSFSISCSVMATAPCRLASFTSFEM